MASGDDPLADYQNMLGLQGLTGPNPYLQFTGQIPMAGFMGAPTNASGQPIQSFTDTQNASNAWNAANPAPGTTLNTSGAVASTANPFAGIQEPQGMNTASTEPRGGLSLAQWNALSGPQKASLYGPQGIVGYSNQTDQGHGFGSDYEPIYGSMQPQAQTQAAPAAAPAPTNPYNMRQAYLDALSNPGHVATPGAQMLPGTSPTGPIGSNQQPSVLQAFLAQHPSGGTAIPGGYSNKSFFNTLNQLQSAKPGATT
jgi:hypothetical protein